MEVFTVIMFHLWRAFFSVLLILMCTVKLLFISAQRKVLP